MLVALRLVTGAALQQRRTFSDSPLRTGPCQVVEVLSGDRLVVRQLPHQQPITVQLIGTAAPPDGPASFDQAARARQFTAEFLSAGEVTLSLDNHRLDQYGNYLVYLEVNGVQLNEALLAAGWARYMRQPGNAASLERRLGDAQRTAQRLQLGIWAASR